MHAAVNDGAPQTAEPATEEEDQRLEMILQGDDNPARFDIEEVDKDSKEIKQDSTEEEEEDLEIFFGGPSSAAAPSKYLSNEVVTSSRFLYIRRSAPAVTATGNEQGGQATKASVDVNAPGLLNGEVIYNVELDSLPEKPWRLPGI